jgi:hypothetical protein
MKNRGGGLGLVVCVVLKTSGRRHWWLRWVRFPHAPAIFAAALLAMNAAPLGAQIPFPTPAKQDTSRADTVQVPSFRFDPPTPPLAAFGRSMLLPGWGQAVLKRRVTGAVFVFWEGVTLTMSLKASHQLKFFRAIGADSTRVSAKKQEVQDWVVLLVFNHLFAGAEAFVAAQLWDFPAEAEVRALPRGWGLGLRVRF